jgi:hypothetical protein
MSLDDQIGQLYGLPLGEFVAARTALAKTLSGDAAKQVKALTKPTVVPWAVNQVYWHARPLFEQMIKTGAALRRAQIASLEGRKADVRQATAAHRAALNAAVREAIQLAEREGASPSPDALSRLFEAISLNDTADEPHGRMTKAVGPAGFEALLGVAVKAPTRAGESAPSPAKSTTHVSDAERRRDEARRAQIDKERAAEERRHQQAIEKAEKAVAAAKADEQEACKAWEDAGERLTAAREALDALRSRGRS